MEIEAKERILMTSLPIDVSNTLPETRQKESAPLLYVAIVAVFPIMLPAVMAMVVNATLYIQSIGVIGADTRYASITYPSPGEKVQERFEARGTVKERPSDSYTFVSGTTGGLYWPKISVTDAEWAVDLTAPGALGYKFDLVVIAVSAEDKDRIEEWFKTGYATGNYPGLQGFSNLQTLAKVKIER